ncbi:AbfB domain-containing protein [Aerosakkonemataceae cyanobacterium BLCC-F154]|uniref:AbfB domain-containing protein n=1 Tax=Floridaenema fluviatile BLCC-F154 TaxID=3153640 RepID=A0ABV4YGA0_9CYAN
MTSIQLQSFNYPDRRIRHRGFLEYLEPISSSLSDLQESSFEIVSGLVGQGMSFKSLYYPEYYLRHQGYRIKLQRNDGSQLFKEDASFDEIPSLVGSGNHASYRSHNYPDRFIRHRNFELWLDPSDNSDLFRQDASFRKLPVPAFFHFQSFNYPDRRIRHRGFLGYLETISSLLDIQDSSFEIVSGLVGQGISFRSFNYPEYYLRHQGYRIKLQRNDGSQLFKEDASFDEIPSLVGSGNHASYRSHNYPDRFIRHKNFELWLDHSDGSDLFRQSASFNKVIVPVLKNQIVVLSDIHIGNNTPTVWYQQGFHEPYLTAVFDYVIQHADSIGELVLLGDVVDFWTYPADEQPPSFDAIMAANPNIFGSNGKLSQVLTALNGNVTYVRGNHDMSLTQGDWDKIQNPNGYKIKLCPDDVYFSRRGGKCIAFTHGHICTMFNAPYKTSQIAPLPLGHFITRAIASKNKKDLKPGQTAADLPNSGEPTLLEKGLGFYQIIADALPSATDLVKILIDPEFKLRAWKALTSLPTALLTIVANNVSGLGDEQPIKLQNGNEVTIGKAKQIYVNQFSEWQNKDDFLGASKAVAADIDQYVGWCAQKLAFEVGADTIVMGHTHTPIYGLSNSLIRYFNTGFHCPSIPDIGTKHPTFLTLNTDNDQASILQVVKAGNFYNISTYSAESTSVVEGLSEDFSCYVIIDNQDGKSELHRKDYKDVHGHYIVSPPETIKPGEIVKFWLQDYPGAFGAEGWVTYTNQDTHQEITLKYGCPFIYSNYCDGSKFYSKSGADSKWVNEVKTSGHPFFVKFFSLS